MKSANEFTLILKQGVCVADGVLVLFAIASDPESEVRIGVTIPKRTGNAVKRNQWKRLIRESFRTQQHRLPRGMNIIVRPKKDSPLKWNAIQKSIPYLVNKAARRLKNAKGL